MGGTSLCSCRQEEASQTLAHLCTSPAAPRPCIASPQPRQQMCNPHIQGGPPRPARVRRALGPGQDPTASPAVTDEAPQIPQPSPDSGGWASVPGLGPTPPDSVAEPALDSPGSTDGLAAGQPRTPGAIAEAERLGRLRRWVGRAPSPARQCKPGSGDSHPGRRRLSRRAAMRFQAVEVRRVSRTLANPMEPLPQPPRCR